MPDHIHLLIGMKPNCCLSDLVREVKKASNSYINGKKWVRGRFEWQSGYGEFSYSHSTLDSVIKNISNQKIHHEKTSFKNEYIKFLNKFQIDYQDEYLFEWPE